MKYLLIALTLISSAYGQEKPEKVMYIKYVDTAWFNSSPRLYSRKVNTIDSLQNLLEAHNATINDLLEYQQYACEVIQSLNYRKIKGTASPKQRVRVTKQTVKAVNNYYKRYGYEN